MASEVYITVNNTHFLIEPAKDFDDNGYMIDGRGYFLSIVKGRHLMAGSWFETRREAETAAVTICGNSLRWTMPIL